MSTNSHLIIRKDYAAHTTFSGHDDKLLEFFQEKHNIYDKFNMDGAGEYEISRDTLVEAIKKAKKLNLDKYTVKVMKADLSWAIANDKDWLQYDHF